MKPTPSIFGTFLRSGRRRRRSGLSGVEVVEARTLLSTIVWADEGTAASDTDNFNATYGANAGTARQIVEQAIRDWSGVIQDFNYANVGTAGNAPVANTYTLDITAGDLGVGRRGVTSNIVTDAAGKPFSADIKLDDNGGGPGWYFDTTPGDHAEFTSLLNRFTSTFTTGSGNDFFRTITHEMGHAMGIALDSNLAIQTGGFLTAAGTDQVETDKSLFRFKGATTTATISTDGGGHIYEGPVDPAFHSDPLNPFDLMNAGRTIGPPPTREIISDLDAGILRDAYGYTIQTPSTIQTFLANLDPTTGVLTVNGDVNTDAAGSRTFVNDTITLDRQGANLRVNVDGVTSTFPIASITSVKVLSTGGIDAINLDFANGSPVPAGGIAVDGGPPSTLPGDSLTLSNVGATALTYTPPTPGNGGSGSFAVGGNTINFTNIESVGFAGPVQNFTYVTPGSQDVLTIDTPGAGQNRISGTSDGVALLPFTFSGITNFTLDTATNDGAQPGDEIAIQQPGLVAGGLENFTINTGAGDDRLTINSGLGLPVPGGRFTFNAGTESTPAGDDLIINAAGSGSGTFTPNSVTALDGVFEKDGNNLFATSLERAEVDGFNGFGLSLPNDANSVTVAPDLSNSHSPAENRVAGITGGVAFSALSFYNTENFIIDAASRNVGGLRGDQFTIDNPGGPALQASGLQYFSIVSGPGNDILTINAADLRLPLGGGGFAFYAGSGDFPDGTHESNLRGLLSLDRVVMNADDDFTLSDLPHTFQNGSTIPDETPHGVYLAAASGGTNLGAFVSFGVEAVTLNGGPSANRIDGTGFNGAFVANGGGGNDTLIGGSGNNTLISGAGNSTLVGGNQRDDGATNNILGGGGVNLLMAGPGTNTLIANSGTTTMIGGAGQDTFVINNPFGTVLAPIGGYEVIGANNPGDRLVLSGGGGADFKETWVVGPLPDPSAPANVTTPNNLGLDIPTIVQPAHFDGEITIANGFGRPTQPVTQQIRYVGIATVSDQVIAESLTVIADAKTGTIAPAASNNLLSGQIGLTRNGASISPTSYQFADKANVGIFDTSGLPLATASFIPPPRPATRPPAVAAPSPSAAAPAPAPVGPTVVADAAPVVTVAPLPVAEPADLIAAPVPVPATAIVTATPHPVGPAPLVLRSKATHPAVSKAPARSKARVVIGHRAAAHPTHRAIHPTVKHASTKSKHAR